MSLLINNPVNSKLGEEVQSQRQSKTGAQEGSLVQHQQGSDQARNGCTLEDDGDQEHSSSGGEVEQNQGQHKLPVHRDLRHETDQSINDATE